MAVDAAGNVYLAGPDFVAKLNTNGTAWVYKRSIGSGVTLAGVAADQGGHAYALGYTRGTRIQTTANALQQAPPDNGNPHTFVVRLNAAGSAFDYATYLTGTDADFPSSIVVDATGAAVLAGDTYSMDFPTQPAAGWRSTPARNYL